MYMGALKNAFSQKTKFFNGNRNSIRDFMEYKCSNSCYMLLWCREGCLGGKKLSLVRKLNFLLAPALL